MMRLLLMIVRAISRKRARAYAATFDQESFDDTARTDHRNLG